MTWPELTWQEMETEAISQLEFRPEVLKLETSHDGESDPASHLHYLATRMFDLQFCLAQAQIKMQAFAALAQVSKTHLIDISASPSQPESQNHKQVRVKCAIIIIGNYSSMTISIRWKF